MKRKVRTNCRICEPMCPLIATLDDAGDVESLEPNLEHPFGGRACHKGLGFLSIHNSPDRLNWPLKRTSQSRLDPPNFESVDWDGALQEIGERVRNYIELYGRNSVAVYLGNPLALNSSGAKAYRSFRRQLKTQMVFNAGTQDSNNHFDATVALYGASIVTVPDIQNTDYILIIGSNPILSKWTLFSVPNDSGERLKAIPARDGKIVYVNPRSLDDPEDDREETLRVKPDTDVYFLAALINEISDQNGFDHAHIAKYGSNFDSLMKFVSKYPAEKVAEIVGLDVSHFRRIAREIIAAPSMSVQLSTGSNQGRQGSLCVLLKEMLSLVTGNLGKRGGNIKPFGGLDVPVGSNTHRDIETSIGVFSQNPFTGSAPAAVLPDLIESGDIKALLVFGGNPVLSIGGGIRLRNALDKLEFCVTTDISPSATTEMSDYVLPATSFLERDDANDNMLGLQMQPYISFAPAATKPKFDRRSDWWIIEKLSESIWGKDRRTDEPGAQMRHVDSALKEFGLSLDMLKSLEHQAVALDMPPPESLFERCIHHPDKKIDCFPEGFVDKDLFVRCDEIFDELSKAPQDQLKLISRRTRHMHNSWHTNVAHFRKGLHAVNTLHMSEDDAKRLSLFDGDMVKVSNHFGEIETRLTVSTSLRPGVVSLPHGYSSYNSEDQTVASALPGANYNELVPTGIDSYEKFSNMTWLNGIPVEVSRV